MKEQNIGRSFDSWLREEGPVRTHGRSANSAMVSSTTCSITPKLAALSLSIVSCSVCQ